MSPEKEKILKENSPLKLKKKSEKHLPHRSNKKIEESPPKDEGPDNYD